MCSRVRQSRSAFTLIELLIVIVVLAVLAVIVMPKFVSRTAASKEAALKSNLKLLRNAVQLFNTDTGLYPKALSDLTTTTGASTNAVDTAGTASTNPSGWNGPYIQGSVPKDPVSGSAFTYTNTSGTVTSSASGNGLDGTAYSTW